MNRLDELNHICFSKLKELNLLNCEKRLEEELKEINAQDCVDYFLNFKEKRQNENNLIVPYLLGICNAFDRDKEPVYDYGDFPDLDIDMLPVIRDYLKEEYTRKEFGEERVCNIVTYQTFGLKSSLLDMARVFDLDRNEILAITKKFKAKDQEGKELTWDEALEIYEDFKFYVQQHPEMAEAAKRLISRTRNMSMHASGVIISSVPIKDYVPLIRVNGSDQSCSAWGEGLQSTDLGPVGFVKFDFLSLKCNVKVALSTEIVEKMTGSKVSALPDQPHWTDLSYLNDRKSLEMAYKGDLRMVFQFDGSEGIRKLAKQCGITGFNDLVAVTSLFRPGTMKMNFHEIYCNRKNGKETYEVHPLVKDFMSETYDILIYQEQVMRMLNVVGKIPLKDCETIRKAISKKKVDKFKKYQDIFIENGQKCLGWNKERVEHLWKQIEAFATYSFNLAHGVAYTYSSSRMLYLKANYPLAFYASVLTCTDGVGESGYKELKMYQKEAENHGIQVFPININKSSTTDPRDVVKNIVEQEKIYWAFDKIKGVGFEMAKKMVSLQPYKDYQDFVERFGTDAKVNKALIALRVFDGDPIKLFYFYEAYKKREKKEQDRRKRCEKSMEKYKDDYKKIESLLCNYEKGVSPIITLDSELEAVEDKDYMDLLLDKEKAEEAYYGFVWTHRLENYNWKYSIDNFVESDLEIGPVDVEIKNVQMKKGPKATYYRVDCEDVFSNTISVNVWKNEYDCFSDYFIKGKCVRLQVKAPSNGFPTYNLVPVSRFKKIVKEQDFRVSFLEFRK